MIKKIILFLSLLFIPATANAELWTLNQILEATCRVDAGNARGSGSCFQHSDGKYYILTNAHVVGNSANVKCEFFKNGRKTPPLPGKVVFRKLIEGYDVDFAVISIDEKLFGKYPPRIAILGQEGDVLIGNYIVSAGCPGARWPNGWEGFLLRENEQLLFYPPPLGGQSGSGLYAVTKRNGELQTVLRGIVTWRMSGGVNGEGYEGAKGGAVSIYRVVDVLNGRVAANPIPSYFHKASDCPGGNCPNTEETPPGLLPIPPHEGDEEAPEEGPYNELPDLGDNTPKITQDELDQLNAQIEGLNVKIQILEAEKAELITNLNTKTAEFQDVNTKLEELTASHTELTAKYTKAVEDWNKDKELFAQGKIQLDKDRDILVAQYNKHLGDFKLEKDKLEESLTNLNQEKEMLSDNVKALNDELLAKETEITKQSKVLDNTVTQVSTLKDKVELITTGANNLLEEKENLAKEKEVAEDTTNKLGWLSGILGTGFLGTAGAWVIRSLIKRKPLTTIEHQLQPVEEKLNKMVESIAGPETAKHIQEAVDKREQELIKLFESKFTDLADRLQKKNDLAVTKDDLDDRVAHLQSQNKQEEIISKLDVIIEKPQPKISDELDAKVNNLKTILEQMPIPTVAEPQNITQTVTVNNPVPEKAKRKQTRRPQGQFAEYLKQLMELKKRDGERVEDWVLLGVLYKEALEQLRAGNLYFRGQTKLQGQETTAQKIDDWVQSEFIKRHNSDEVDLTENKDLEAFIGLLYKEAMGELRQGKFQVLGAKETAEEIERFVNKKYSSKMGLI